MAAEENHKSGVQEDEEVEGEHSEEQPEEQGDGGFSNIFVILTWIIFLPLF